MLKQLTEGSVFLGWWLKMAICWDVTLCSLLKVYWLLEVSAAFTIMVDEQSTCENDFTVIVVMTDYILQTSHSIWTRLKLWHWSGCLEQPDKSSVAVRSVNMWHQIDVQHTSVLANKFKICGPHSQRRYWAQSRACKMDRKDGLMSCRLADCTSTFCFGQSSLTLRTA